MSRKSAAFWLVVLVLAGAGVHIARDRLAAKAAKTHHATLVSVAVAPAATQDVPVFLDGLGTVQAFNTVTVRAMIDGPLTEIAFQQGQDVRAGDVLARIDPRPYQATLDQNVAKKAQDEANLANAKLDLARYEKLVQNKFTSAQTADTQRATVAADEALVQQDQALIDAARTQLSYTVIKSPIDGRTGIRQVDIGNIVHPTDTNGIVVITQLKPIYVLFSLPQQTLPQVQAAMQRGPVPVLVLPQDDVAGGVRPSDPDVLDHGTLVVVDNQVDSTTGTIRLRASFPNQSLKLWPGGFVNARLLVNTLHDAVTVPPTAVQRGPDGAFVYVLNPRDTVSRRTVTIGHEDQVAAVVTAGLQAGDQVVTDGAARLTDGMHVTVSSTQAPSGPDVSQAPAAPTREAQRTKRAERTTGTP